MGILTELFKEIPLSAVLQEKVAALEAKYGYVETENAILKDDLRQANAQIVKLKQEIKRLTHVDELDEISIKLLTYLAKRSEFVECAQLDRLLKLPTTQVKHYMDKLEEQGYVEGKHYAGGAISLYSLTPKGRKYAVNNNLI